VIPCSWMPVYSPSWSQARHSRRWRSHTSAFTCLQLPHLSEDRPENHHGLQDVLSFIHPHVVVSVVFLRSSPCGSWPPAVLSPWPAPHLVVDMVEEDMVVGVVDMVAGAVEVDMAAAAAAAAADMAAVDMEAAAAAVDMEAAVAAVDMEAADMVVVDMEAAAAAVDMVAVVVVVVAAVVVAMAAVVVAVDMAAMENKAGNTRRDFEVQQKTLTGLLMLCFHAVILHVK
ncbi:hypothetical protein Hamer_G001136, partial [Homarus americanus]